MLRKIVIFILYVITICILLALLVGYLALHGWLFDTWAVPIMVAEWVIVLAAVMTKEYLKEYPE